MPKLKSIQVISDKCKICGMFGPCKGKVLPPDNFCLGFKENKTALNNGADNLHEDHAPPSDSFYFISSANNGSICDECFFELDGFCKLTWAVGLYKVKECANFKVRILHKEAV